MYLQYTYTKAKRYHVTLATVVSVCEALICKKALSVKIIGPLSPKALKCKKIGWPLSIIALICKNDVGSNALVQVHWHQRRD